jgi:Tfp pilus assembly protein PilZ
MESLRIDLIVKRIPVAEKRYRLEQQEQRLAGIAISGELEPSHQLLDLTNNVLETGSIIWIAPSRCTKRSEEVQLSIKERPSAVQVENQQLKIAQI